MHLYNYSDVDYLLLMLLLVGLVANSLIYGIRVSLRPPDQIYNPIAVVKGVIMVFVYLDPMIFILCNKNAPLSLIIIAAHSLLFAAGLGIVGTIWYVKHTVELDVHTSIEKLAQAR